MANQTKPITQKTGDAGIDRQGQTAMAGTFGSDPNVKAVRRPAPVDLNP